MIERRRIALALGVSVCLTLGFAIFAQSPPPTGVAQVSTRMTTPEGPGGTYTLKQAVALALRNSREFALARVQEVLAEKSAAKIRAEFRPNLFSGSGLAYTRGFPQTQSGGPPPILEVVYSQAFINSPLRGELRAAEQHVESQRLAMEAARDSVILRTASAYLELAKVRHALELVRRERESAQKILDVTEERAQAGLELSIEVTKAQLSRARVEQRILQLEGREETLEADLHNWTALPADQRMEVAYEELPAGPEQPSRDLLAQALANNVSLKQAEAERRVRAERLRGERGSFWPTFDIIGQYGMYARFNNADQFFNRFRRNNLTAGVELRIPIYSARARAALAYAETDLSAAEMEERTKRENVQIEVRQQARKVRELEAAREVARLELQLTQESLQQLQAKFQEGRTSLRDLEKARLEESDRWLAFLDADFDRQKAQLEVLRTTGQLSRLFQ